MRIKIETVGEYYEYFCDDCQIFYHQSFSIGDEKSFRKWIKEHLNRHEEGLLKRRYLDERGFFKTVGK